MVKFGILALLFCRSNGAEAEVVVDLTLALELEVDPESEAVSCRMRACSIAWLWGAKGKGKGKGATVLASSPISISFPPSPETLTLNGVPFSSSSLVTAGRLGVVADLGIPSCCPGSGRTVRGVDALGCRGESKLGEVIDFPNTPSILGVMVGVDGADI